MRTTEADRGLGGEMRVSNSSKVSVVDQDKPQGWSAARCSSAISILLMVSIAFIAR
jgi:hypothetical protein